MPFLYEFKFIFIKNQSINNRNTQYKQKNFKIDINALNTQCSNSELIYFSIKILFFLNVYQLGFFTFFLLNLSSNENENGKKIVSE